MGFILVFIVGAVVATLMINQQNEKADILPIYNPSEVNPELVDESLQNKGTGHVISDFSLTNHLGQEVSLSSYKGKILVVDFFFVSCPSICPKMTSQLERVQKKFKGDGELMILSHTVLPEKDTVEVLANYADLHEADPSQWHFLTGDKKEIYRLARKSYFVVKEAGPDEGDGGESDFIHTENFVLVDKKGRIRGFYDGTSPTEVDQLMMDIQKLKKEESSS